MSSWHFSGVALAVLGTVGVASLARMVWSAGKEGVAEGLAQAKATIAAEAEAEREATSRETAPYREELGTFSEPERYGLLLQAPFREFLFHGPLQQLDWGEAAGKTDPIWLETYRLPADKLERTRTALSREWGIHGPDSLREKVDWLLTQGHRDDVREMFDVAALLDTPGFAPERAPSKPVARAAEVARHWRERVGEHGGDAFDIARAATLVADGMALGELDETEGRALLAACWEDAHGRFPGWETYGASFLAGGGVWMALAGVTFAGVQRRWWARTVDWLTHDPAGAWARNPWPAEATPPVTGGPRTLH